MSQWTILKIVMEEPERRDLCKRFRDALQNNDMLKMNQYLESRDYYSGGTCKVCLLSYPPQSIGNHFVQSKKSPDHQKVVGHYCNRARRFLKSMLEIEGFELRENESNNHNMMTMRIQTHYVDYLEVRKIEHKRWNKTREVPE